MSRTLSEIKMAAYNWVELPDMTQKERLLWMGLGYCMNGTEAIQRTRPHVMSWQNFILDIFGRSRHEHR